MAPWPPPTRRQQRPPSSSRDNPECPQGHKTALLGDRRPARCWLGAGAVGHRDVPASTLSTGLRDSPHILPHSSCILRGAAWSAEPLAPWQGNGGSPACFTLTRDSADRRGSKDRQLGSGTPPSGSYLLLQGRWRRPSRPFPAEKTGQSSWPL